MSVFETIISIIIPIGFALLYMLQRNFLTNYLNQKGKNLAEKEDIESITRLVEKVRIEFNRDIEYLKADLGVSSNTKIHLINEERNAVISFYKSYFEWYVSNTTLSQDATSFENVKIELAIADLSIKYAEMLRSEAVFELFVDDLEFKLDKTKLRHNTGKAISEASVSFLYSIIQNNLEIEYTKMQLADIGNFSRKDELLKKIQECLERRKVLHQKFLEYTLKNHQAIITEQSEFQSKCKNHLYRLLEKEK